MPLLVPKLHLGTEHLSPKLHFADLPGVGANPPRSPQSARSQADPPLPAHSPFSSANVFGRVLAQMARPGMKNSQPKSYSGYILANGPTDEGSAQHSRSGSPSTLQIHPPNFTPALPGQLFYSTQLLVCLWFLAKVKPTTQTSFPDRRTRTLFIEAREMARFD